MKKTILFLLTLIGLSASANAASIIVQSGATPVEFKLSGGARLPLNGGGIVLGFFRTYTTGTVEQVAAALAGTDRTAVLNYVTTNFVPIGTEAANANYGNISAANPLSLRDLGAATTAAGAIENSTWQSATGAAPANSVQAGGLVRGTKIFILAYAGTSLAESTDLGVFSASNWNLPTSTTLSSLSMTLTQVDDLNGATATREVFRGQLGSLVLAPFNVVPETSSSVLAILAGMGLISRRRR